MRGDCERCEQLEALGQQDTDALIAAQLELEVRNLVADEVRDQRLKICSTCPFLVGGLCQQCGCYTRFRASLRNKSCPIGKWHRQEKLN